MENLWAKKEKYPGNKQSSMKSFLVLFRERESRDTSFDAAQAEHQKAWKKWLEEWSNKKRLKGGKPLTLQGNVITTNKEVMSGPYFLSDEFVGGFLLLDAEDMEEATAIIQSCPVFETGGFAEVREMA